MCGIAGLISSDPALLSLIGQMNWLLRHRGPDDEGYLIAGPKRALPLSGDSTPSAIRSAAIPYRPVQSLVAQAFPEEVFLALGHRRLAILDLSPLGHQPMSYLDRYWIVYNGEIYNYLELRQELEKDGSRFVSQSDTEVILAAYSRWGVDCLSRFNGMFAFALFDRDARRVLLARDRFGVKPLYYWAGAGFLAFASEIKAFSCLPHWHPRVNGQAAYDYLLSSLQDHSSETLFEDVLQLDPGCCISVEIDRVIAETRRTAPAHSIKRWYSVSPAPFSGTFDQASSEFRQLLTDAVRLRLRSDVTVGSCLSGGLDSSSIVCIADQLLRRHEPHDRQQTFSACAELERFDERRYIKQVVAATQVHPHYAFPSLDKLFDQLDQLIWHQDEPFGSTSVFAQWTVFELARHHATPVMLDGQGADELFYGYTSFRRPFIAGLVRSGRWRTSWLEAGALRRSRSKALSLLLRAAVDAVTPIALQKRLRQSRKNRQPPLWLSPARLQASFPGRLARRFQSHTNAAGLSRELISGGHLQMLLHWEDRNSMAHAVESRLPFLDYRMVEFALSLPDEFKIRAGVTKAVLRQGMRGIVPQPILDRTDKMGFVTPEEVWVREEGTARFRDSISEAISLSQDVLTGHGLQQFESMVEGALPYEWSIWRMICFGRWIKRFGLTV